jgi:serine/threonine-protein kinase HipA
LDSTASHLLRDAHAIARPERTDRFNLQSIEFATLDLARRCGLSTCQAQLQKVSGRDVLMLKRFDRQPLNGGYFRLGFVSALTVLDAESPAARLRRVVP